MKPPRKSVQIVESKRINGKVKQRVVQHIGVASDEAELEELKLYANSIKIKLELNGSLPLYDTNDIDITVEEPFRIAKHDLKIRPIKSTQSL